MTDLNVSQRLSQEEFALLGTDHFVYAKPIEHQGEAAFAIHLANGDPVALTSTWEAARETAGNYNVQLLSVH